MSEEPIDHVLRSLPPWDNSAMTQCGKAQVAGRLLTRDEFTAKVKRQGQQRSALTTCMTCWTTAGNYRPWSESPTECVSRWLDRARHRREQPHDTHLRAVAALIEAHREEYDGFIEGVEHVSDLHAHRLERARDKQRLGHQGRP